MDPTRSRDEETSSACCPPARPMPELPTGERAADELLARLSKALGHPTRVAILRMLLRQQGCIVGELVERLPYAQSTVSQHLKHLKEAGFVRGEVDGPRVCYCAEPATVAVFERLVLALCAEAGGTSEEAPQGRGREGS